MKKKLLIILLCMVSAVACALGISACNIFDKPDEGHVHSIIHIDKQDATCTQEGNREYWYCTSCGDCFTDANGENRVSVLSFRIEKLPHDEVIDYAVPATCTEDGKTQGKHCFVCGEVIVEQKRVPAGHTYVIEPAVPATCTEDGLTEGKYCFLCKLVVSEQQVIPAGHTIVEEEEVAATCTKDGHSAYKHCKNCDFVESEPTIFAATGHTEVDDDAVSATCTEEGKTAGKHCSVCDTVIVEQQTIPAAGHDMTHNEGQAADCVTVGVAEHWNCSVCEKNFADEDGEAPIENLTIPKTVHNYVEKYVCTLCNTGTGTFGLEYEYDSEEDTYTVSYIGTATGDIIIPHYYNGKLVTAVGDGAFADRWDHNIVTIEIPDSVTVIGDYAFIYLDCLLGVTIGKNVTSIGDSAFAKCYNLSGELALPASLKTIGNEAFLGCPLTGKLEIPDGVVSIGESAFFGCDFSGELVIPDSVVTIGVDAFRECKNLTALTIGSGTASITKGAPNSSSSFIFCTGLNKITVSKQNNTYHSAGNCLIETASGTVILGCNTSVIPDDGSVKAIGGYAFHGCEGLTGKFTVPDSVVLVDCDAFAYCTGLTSIVLGNSVSTINERTFWGCKNLTDITFPASLTEISYSLFAECTSLKYIFYYGTQTQWKAIKKGSWGKESNYQMFYLADFDYEYNAETDSYWVSFTNYGKDFGNIILPSTYQGKPIKGMGGDVFWGCTITGVLIPDSTTAIDNVIFNQCSGLKTLIIGSGLTECDFAQAFMYGSKATLSEIIVSADNPAFYSMGNCIIEKESKTLVLGCNNSVIPTDGSITSIGAGAFANATQMTSVTVPDSVKSIGAGAFAGCTALNSIVFPDSVKKVGAGVVSDTAYYNDASNWDGDLLYVDNHLVAAKSTIATFPQIKAGTLTIAGKVFYNYSAMTGSIDIPDSVVYIGDEAFYNCGSLTGQLVVPAGVEIIGTNAFSSCEGITGVTFPEGIISIGNGAFSWCEGITGSVTIPASVTYIGGSTFYICSNLEEINVDVNNTKYASYQGILYNKEMTEIVDVPRGIKGDITIPDGVTKIANSEFYYCVNLESVHIPNSVTEIGYHAFSHCLKLESVNIPDGITAIPMSMFYECTSLKSITIPDSVTEICSEAFRSSGLTGEFVVSDNVTKVGSSAFEDCYNLTSVTLPDGITEIAYCLFEGCSKLTSVNIPDSVTSIEYGAFASCGKLESISIPDGVTEIGELAFFNCNSLTGELILPQNLKTIVKRAFEGCSGFTGTLVIPMGVTSIGDSAFNGCTRLTGLTLSNTVTTIGSKAFYNCVKLSGELIIPDSVESIGKYAFNYCNSLTSIKIPNSVTCFDSAFEDCSSLESVIILDGVETIGSYAFYSCSKLNSVTIPKSVTEIKVSALSYCTELTDIYYEGTMAEWTSLINNKGGVEWAYKAGNYTVHCSDGDIAKS